jgi:hypothetical protein
MGNKTGLARYGFEKSSLTRVETRIRQNMKRRDDTRKPNKKGPRLPQEGVYLQSFGDGEGCVMA